MLTSDLSLPGPLVIDTHIWVWTSTWVAGRPRFARAAATAIEQAAREGRLFASAASVWEISLKAQKGELLVSGDLSAWVRAQIHPPGVRISNISAALALESTSMPRWERSSDGREHKDASDRFIVATARRLGAVLITCDELMLEYARAGHVLAYDART